MLLGLAVSTAVTANGGEVRISFLRQSAVLLETFGILRSAGCSDMGTLAFQRAVERSNSIPFTLDFGRFPEARAGFYAFPFAVALVRALPGPLFALDRLVDINCLSKKRALVVRSCASILPTGRTSAFGWRDCIRDARRNIPTCLLHLMTPVSCSCVRPN